MIYLDNASTSFVYPECIEAVNEVLTKYWGNPSNIYAFGDEPKKIIEEAKIKLAKCINCDPEEIFFTSGASEGNAWAQAQGETTFHSPYEHHNYSDNPMSEEVGDDKEVLHGYEDVYAHMLVSNITGEIFDVRERFDSVEEGYVFKVCDCTQAYGNVEIKVRDLGCDMAVFSGHKFHAPKGIGFVWIRKEVQSQVESLIFGTQQNGLRGGTENVAYIKAIGIAAERAESERTEKESHSEELRNICLKKLKDSGIDFVVNEGERNINSTLNFCLKGISTEVIQMMLSDKEIFIGTGSGCADGSMDHERTLEVMGVPEEYLDGQIRLSFSLENTKEEAIEAMDEIISCYKLLTK